MKQQNKIKSFDGVIRREKVSSLPTTPLLSREEGSLWNMFYSSLKVGGVGALTFALFISISISGSTMAYFNDTETSRGNKMQAGTVSFNLSSFIDEEGRLLRSATVVGDTEVLEVQKYEGGAVGTQEFSVNVVPDGSSLPLLYSVRGELDPENPAGCDLMAVDVSFGDYHYIGLLKDFVSPKTSDMGEWYFLIALPVSGAVLNSDLPPKAECKGQMVFGAELADVPDDLSGTYTDKKAYLFELYNWDTLYIDPSESLVEETPPEVFIPEYTAENIEGGLPAGSSALSAIEEVPLPPASDPEGAVEPVADPEVPAEIPTEEPAVIDEPLVVEPPAEEVTPPAPPATPEAVPEAQPEVL